MQDSTSKTSNNSSRTNETSILHGCIERITYHNEENGFCVLKIAIKNKKDLVTLVGNASQVICGEDIEAHGVWIYDKQYGQQFKAHSIKVTIPNSIEGIKKYLSSGLIKGVGQHFAGVLVDKFKEKVFDVLDNEPDLINGLPGIGEKRSKRIIDSWQEQKTVREVMLFLYNHGIGSARAVRIYKTYGDDAIKKLETNPYCLALDIWGIGFKTADQLAISIGIPRDSVLRAEAGIRHVINEYSNSGHCAILLPDLIDKAVKMLEINQDTIKIAIDNEINNGNIIKEECNQITKKDLNQNDDQNSYYIYLAPIYYSESGVTASIKRLKYTSWIDHQSMSDEEIIQLATQNTHISFSDSQKRAIIMAIRNKVSIITGGPGVGKTTIIKGILNVIKSLDKRVSLCAPTGRATKRLAESSGCFAKTIHRMLEYKPGEGAKYHINNPLQTDCIIVDEVSMVDISLMNTLLKAIPDHALLLFVGDVDQLPSVGPGSVLGDMINSHVIATTKLTEIFRQANTSKIITNAHRINKSETPYYTNQPNDDFFFIELEDNELILQKILSIVKEKLPNMYQFNPLLDIQILTPMNKGNLGVKNMNFALQETLNSIKNHENKNVTSMGINFRIGDKVIQTVNNYNKEVFNGDIGYIESIDIENDLIMIKFDDNIVEYEKSELDEIDLAYAISIHKSQGSEYPVVIIPLSTQHYALLERNLLYTGVTRGKKMVILIGQKKALYMAVKKVSANKRITGLEHKLRIALG